MEKWRIYLIMAGVVLIVYNVENIYLSSLEDNYKSVIGVVFSVLFIVLLLVFRKKEK